MMRAAICRTKTIFAASAWVPFPDFWVNLCFNRWIVKWGLRKAFYDAEKITDARIDAYFDRLRTRGGIDSVAAATSIDPELALTYAGRIHDIKQETIIIWGRNDNWIPLKDGCRFNQDIKRSDAGCHSAVRPCASGGKAGRCCADPVSISCRHPARAG